jgi:YD repeat-containing protein
MPCGSANGRVSGQLLAALVVIFCALSTATSLAATTYFYDSLNRLIKVVYPDNTTIVYTYDAAGNRLTSTVVPGTVAPAFTTQPSNKSATVGQAAQFAAVASGTGPIAYRWQVSTNSGSSWTPLLDSGPYSGVTTTSLQVLVETGFNGYLYRCLATNDGGSTSSGTATLAVYGAASASPSSLRFGASRTGSGPLTHLTPAQTVAVTFAGAASAWTATANQSWIQIANGSGSGAGSFNVTINPNDLSGASTSLNGTITLMAATAPNPSMSIPVSLTVTARPTAPFGSFDTPVAGASVAGSIAVTGWALDDIGIDRVEIWRDRAAGETTPVYTGAGLGNGKIFIANPLFISGARPDVEAAYSSMPFASRAGWGYLLLTQGLWNQGNDVFTLYAIAYDKDDHSSLLGSKTITVSNATSVRPFGSIDLPTYGQTVTSSFWNFGWALTPNATPTCTVPPSGVQVSIDSRPLVPVAYGDLRTDIASAFPGFSNGAGAGGAYYIDTSTLTDGTHLIGWYVVDSCNRAEGIGSRFFTVLNGSGAVPALEAPPMPRPSPSQEAVLFDAPIEVRRGAETTLVHPGPDGTRVVAIGQNERVELQLPTIIDARYTGYQIVSGERRTLPLGSSLDAELGLFYWQPGPGFLGAHDLEFVTSPDGVPVRVRAVVGTAVQR